VGGAFARVAGLNGAVTDSFGLNETLFVCSGEKPAGKRVTLVSGVGRGDRVARLAEVTGGGTAMEGFKWFDKHGRTWRDWIRRGRLDRPGPCSNAFNKSLTPVTEVAGLSHMVRHANSRLDA
jgi:hypothetical protein